MFNNEQRKKLTEVYPYLIPVNGWTGKIEPDYDYSYIQGEQLPDSWFKLFLLLCKNLHPMIVKSNLLHSFYFVQLKEKYGTMRVHTSGCTNNMNDLINVYESFSKYICQHCGKFPTKVMTTGWITFLCEDCLKDDDCPVEKVKYKKHATVEYYSQGSHSTIRWSYKPLRKEYKYIEKLTEEQFFTYLTNI